MTIDVTGLQDVESIKQRIAVAQIVFTLTAIDGVDEVVILSEGQPRSLTTELGGSQAGEPLTREKHFPTLSARLNPNAPSTTTTVVVQAPSTSVP
ncbi:MAG: GerMN domain-containing protein [Acidimicrobiales bacterium]